MTEYHLLIPLIWLIVGSVVLGVIDEETFARRDAITTVIKLLIIGPLAWLLLILAGLYHLFYPEEC